MEPFSFSASPMKEQLLDYLEEVCCQIMFQSVCCYVLVTVADGNGRCIAVQAAQFEDGATSYSARTRRLHPPPHPPQNAGRRTDGQGEKNSI